MVRPSYDAASFRKSVTISDYQAKYLAHELIRRCPSDSVEKLTIQKQIEIIEFQRKDKRRALLKAQDTIDEHQEQLIGSLFSLRCIIN